VYGRISRPSAFFSGSIFAPKILWMNVAEKGHLKKTTPTNKPVVPQVPTVQQLLQDLLGCLDHAQDLLFDLEELGVWSFPTIIEEEEDLLKK